MNIFVYYHCMHCYFVKIASRKGLYRLLKSQAVSSVKLGSVCHRLGACFSLQIMGYILPMGAPFVFPISLTFVGSRQIPLLSEWPTCYPC